MARAQVPISSPARGPTIVDPPAPRPWPGVREGLRLEEVARLIAELAGARVRRIELQHFGEGFGGAVHKPGLPVVEAEAEEHVGVLHRIEAWPLQQRPRRRALSPGS